MKRLNIFIIAMLFYTIASAQWKLGAKTGISIPNLQGNSEQSKGYTSRKGFYAGVLANIELSSIFSLQTEINFSPQGGQKNGMQPVPGDFISGITLPLGTILYASFNSATIINYLEIPVLLQHSSGNKLKYQLQLGPYIAFRIEATTKTKGGSLLYIDEKGSIPLELNGLPLPPVDFTGTTNIKDDIKTINAGVQGGLAFLYNLGPGYVFAEGRGIRGLINIQSDTGENGKNQTGSLVIVLGYTFILK